MPRWSRNNATDRHAAFLLFVPGDRPERFEKAICSGADAIIVDLEDAVAAANKVAARNALRASLWSLLARRETQVFVRVNGVDTPWHEDDVRALADFDVDGVVLPKSETAADLNRLRAALGERRRKLALVETARGLAAARSVAEAADQLLFGSLDFCADLACAHQREVLQPARFEIVLASRLAGLAPPIDGVTTGVGDAEAVVSDSRYAAALGFGGKSLIHPTQVEPARRGFLVSEGEITWAKKVLAGAETGAVRIDGQMVDAPVIARARGILERAKTPSEAG